MKAARDYGEMATLWKDWSTRKVPKHCDPSINKMSSCRTVRLSVCSASCAPSRWSRSWAPAGRTFPGVSKVIADATPVGAWRSISTAIATTWSLILPWRPLTFGNRESHELLHMSIEISSFSRGSSIRHFRRTLKKFIESRFENSVMIR